MNTKTFEDVLNEKGSLLYQSIGTSMLPLIKEGRDYIYITRRTEERLKRNDVAFFKRPNVKGRGRYVLHRVRRVNKDGTYRIIGDNCFDAETVREENVLGVLSAVKRKGKTVTVNDFGYRVYVAFVPLRRFFLFPYRICVRILRILYRKLKYARKTP